MVTRREVTTTLVKDGALSSKDEQRIHNVFKKQNFPTQEARAGDRQSLLSIINTKKNEEIENTLKSLTRNIEKVAENIKKNIINIFSFRADHFVNKCF